MKILLERIFTCEDYTIGHLYIDGKYVCDTIEDCDRGLTQYMSEKEIAEKKVYGKTAIPSGKYSITMNVKSPKYSNSKYKWAAKYDGYLPRLENVPGFEGVLMHVGNTANDSLGCILVGENKVKGQVINSTTTFHNLMDNYLWIARQCGEKITIEIKQKY